MAAAALKHLKTMAQITTEQGYELAMQRIEELLQVVSDDMPMSDPRMWELDMLSELVSEYEDVHYPMPVAPVQPRRTPSLPRVAAVL